MALLAQQAPLNVLSIPPLGPDTQNLPLAKAPNAERRLADRRVNGAFPWSSKAHTQKILKAPM